MMKKKSIDDFTDNMIDWINTFKTKHKGKRKSYYKWVELMIDELDPEHLYESDDEID
jgi:hypothetical protein